MTDTIRFVTHTIYNGENSKLEIFSFLPERQSIESNFKFFIHTIHNGDNVNFEYSNSNCIQKQHYGKLNHAVY